MIFNSETFHVFIDTSSRLLKSIQLYVNLVVNSYYMKILPLHTFALIRTICVNKDMKRCRIENYTYYPNSQEQLN